MMQKVFVTAALLMAGVAAAQEESAPTPQVPTEQTVPEGGDAEAVRETNQTGNALPGEDAGVVREDAGQPPAEQPPVVAQEPTGERADSPGEQGSESQPAAGEQGVTAGSGDTVGEGKPEGEGQPSAEEQGVTAEPGCETGECESGCACGCQAVGEREAAEPEGESDEEEQGSEDQPSAEEQGAMAEPGCGTGECGPGCACGCQAAGEQGAEEPEGEAEESEPGRESFVPAGESSSAEEPEEERGEEPRQDLSAAYRGIVKIEVANRMPDYNVPWRAGQFGRGTGTGFMVEPGVFMTNAHVVGNAERINVSPYADARKIPAKVKFVAHDADLALVEVEDAGAFKDVPYLEFSTDMPKLEDSVRAIGYPIGGNRLSVTRGIVSRIDTIPYAHTQNESHLTVQIDAAINPGNSGGPVLMGDKVVGVAFQGLREANSTGYMIPLPVINRFRKDVQDGHYDYYVKIGAQFFPMENPAMRKHYKLPDDAMGAIVGEVIRGSGADGKLRVGDIVLAVNGLPVDSSAMIELGGERVKLEEMAERAFNGDVLTFNIIRNGKVMEVKVAPRRIPAADIMGNEFDAMPRYVHFAGLIFQPLQRGVIEAHRMDPGDFVVEMDEFINRGGSLSKEDVVVLTDVLADEVNARFDDSGTGIVTKVNGQEVKGLRHLHELLYPKDGKRTGDYTTIEFKDAPRPFVIDNAVLDASNERISDSYNIPANARLD